MPTLREQIKTLEADLKVVRAAEQEKAEELAKARDEMRAKDRQLASLIDRLARAEEVAATAYRVCASIASGFRTWLAARDELFEGPPSESAPYYGQRPASQIATWLDSEEGKIPRPVRNAGEERRAFTA